MGVSKQQVTGLDPIADEHDVWSFWHRFKELSVPKMHDVARYNPLVAAILAPLSTLLDVPALTQRWYTFNGSPVPDPTVSLVLSAIGLFLNVLANLLLLLRFSTRTRKYTAIATRVSLASWIGKTLVAAANLIVFGITTRNDAGYTYSEGFWSAVVSIIDAGIISILLLLHYFYAFRHGGDSDLDIRMHGRQFMLSVTAFLAIVGIQALVFCKIEDWAYLDAIYFSVQTALTIGFGDYAPTHTAGKILVFVFSVLTISQLGNEIAMIISFISDRANERRDRWRRKYEGMMHREADLKRPGAGLVEEMALIHEINNREEMMSQLYDLFWSAMALIVFWVVGAAMFSQIEGWTYGNGLYMVMVLSLTIGFGDYTPVTPAGKVVFIVYALAAVPIVTSFAVQTITGLLSTYSERRSRRDRYRRVRRMAPDVFKSHADYLEKAHETYGEIRDRLLGVPAPGDGDDMDADKKLNSDKEERSTTESSTGSSAEGSRTDGGDAEVQRASEAVEAVVRNQDERGSVEAGPEQEEDERQLELGLVKQLMELTIKLEAEARELLLDTMEHGVPRTLLLADRNVQIRDVKAVRGDDANVLSIWRGIEEDKNRQSDHQSGLGKLDKVRKYRNTFAEILVIGAILQRLEGDDLSVFERWRERQKEEMEGARQAEESMRQEDLERIADEHFDGLTSSALRDQLRKFKGSKIGCISDV